MAGKGPPKTPTAVLKARGSWLAKLPERANEPGSLPEAAIECPAAIVSDSDASDYWETTIKPLFIYGIVTVADVKTVIRMCRAWARQERAERLIAADGQYVDGAEHPAMKTINSVNEFLTRIEPHFGIGPANRSRVTNAITKRPEGETHDKKRFFKAG